MFLLSVAHPARGKGFDQGLEAVDSMMLSLSAHYDPDEEESCVPSDVACMSGAEFEEKFDLSTDAVGRGRTSLVKVVKNKQSQELLACKIVEKRRLPRLRRLRDEIRILDRVNHPSIVSLHGVVETTLEVLLLTDLAEGGDLYERIVRKRYSEQESRKIITQVLWAVQYLHENNIIHRDIKPENILIVSKMDDTVVKIADFGAAKIYEAGQAGSSTGAAMMDTSDDLIDLDAAFSPSRMRAYTSIGTDNYIAPEISKGDGYGAAVDMWSIGIVTYLLLVGTLPFATSALTTEDARTRKLIFPATHSEHISSQAKLFVAGLLALNPDDRLTCSQAIAHPWLVA